MRKRRRIENQIKTVAEIPQTMAHNDNHWKIFVKKKWREKD